MYQDKDNDGKFPDESPVEVRYPRSKQEEQTDRGDPLHDGGRGLRRGRLRGGRLLFPHLRPGPGARPGRHRGPAMATCPGAGQYEHETVRRAGPGSGHRFGRGRRLKNRCGPSAQLKACS